MKEDKLPLTNYIPFNIDQKTLTESINDPNKPFIVSGIVQRADAENQNNRIYPKKILEREVEKYRKKIQEKNALGELDHPDSSVINLLNVSHNVLDVWWDGKDVLAKIEILSTPSGNILKELFRKGIKVGISSRGFGSVKENKNGIMEVDDDFELLCFDFVSDPSTRGAFQTPIKEGRVRGLTSEQKVKIINELVYNIIELYNRK